MEMKRGSTAPFAAVLVIILVGIAGVAISGAFSSVVPEKASSCSSNLFAESENATGAFSCGSPGGRYIEISMGATKVTGTTATTVLKHFTIPGNSIGAHGYLEWRFYVQPFGTSNTKTFQILLDGKAYLLLPYSASSTLPNLFTFYIWNVNATNNQSTFWYFLSAPDTLGGAGPVNTFYSSSYDRGTSNSIDTTLPINCTITGKLAVSSDSLSFGFLSVLAVNPAS